MGSVTGCCRNGILWIGAIQGRKLEISINEVTAGKDLKDEFNAIVEIPMNADPTQADLAFFRTPRGSSPGRRVDPSPQLRREMPLQLALM